MLHCSSLIAGDAGVVAIVVGREVGDSQWAGEVDVVHSHTQADGNWPSIFLPGDVQRAVARHDHAGDEDTLADGETLELKGLNVGRHWQAEEERDKGTQRSNVISAVSFKDRLDSLDFVADTVSFPE